MSEKPKWTPGPWRITPSGNISNTIEGPSGQSLFEGDDGFRGVAMVQACGSGMKYDEKEANQLANMRLISAAPDLYEALEQCAAFLKHVEGHGYGGMSIFDVASESTRRALAKARGEEGT